VPIENGVNLERFRPMDKFEARRQLGLPETGYIYIGWVGYFFPWSGVETLLEAAKKILAEFPNARFIIVGHGIWGTHLSDFAQSLGLKVHLMKPLNNAPSHSPKRLQTNLCPFSSTVGISQLPHTPAGETRKVAARP